MTNKYTILTVLSLFFVVFSYPSSSDDGLLSKEQFIEVAFGNKEALKGKLRFKDEVKTAAQKNYG